MSQAPQYRKIALGGCLSAMIERRPDGCQMLRSTEALKPFPANMNDRFMHWVRAQPEALLVAKRVGPDQLWEGLSYRQMFERIQCLAQALLDRGLSQERPLVILSDNDLEHLSLGLAANWVGIPYCSVSSAYSLMSGDYAKLKHILATLTPGLVFASGQPYFKAIINAVSPGLEIVLTNDLHTFETDPSARRVSAFASLLKTQPTSKVAEANALVTPATISKFLFTSGSTKQPKGVPITQRMWCANQQMLSQAMAFLEEERPVLVDWLPWNHVFGGNHNVGIVLFHGGTLYIDAGRPTPNGIKQTLENLREISPTIYFNVPKGFEEIVSAMEGDAALAANFFKRVKAFMFAGAGLAQSVWDRLDQLAERTVGERIQMLTGLGMTETAPADLWALGTHVRSGHLGLPCPGVEAKLVPLEGKLEVRFRGPNVMNGYWRNAEQTAEAFDEEGFYCTGDAVKFLDAGDPQKGLLFDGRIAEDFKLSTGTFVSVGPLRAKVIAAGAPWVQDAVVTGLNYDEIGLIFLPRVEDCRSLAGLPTQAPLAEIFAHENVRDFFQKLVNQLWAGGTGSASRVARAVVLIDPPSIDRGEVTDKGSINQRAVLLHRAALVEALHAGTAPDTYLASPGG